MSTCRRVTARLVRPPGGPDVPDRDGVAGPGPGGSRGLVTAAGDPPSADPGRAAAPGGELAFTAVLPPGTAARVPEEARKRVLEAADRLCGGSGRPWGCFAPTWTGPTGSATR